MNKVVFSGIVNNYDTSVVVQIVKDYSNETENNYPTASGISLTSSVFGKELSVNISTYLKYVVNNVVVCKANSSMGYQYEIL